MGICTPFSRLNVIHVAHNDKYPGHLILVSGSESLCLGRYLQRDRAIQRIGDAFRKHYGKCYEGQRLSVCLQVVIPTCEPKERHSELI